jgi:FtsP/CotA-like multicopper oxidase with cupredoxin domain
MADMGMAHGPMSATQAEAIPGMDHSAMGHGQTGGMDAMAHAAMNNDKANAMTAMMHGPDDHGRGNETIAMMPTNRLNEPGIGLENTDRRVLVYTDLRNTRPGYDLRAPSRDIELHLTGSMQRFIWSFDGKKFSEAEPIRLRYGERVRFTFVNDTMMNHPLHLHGMWSELDNGVGAYKPRKHVINVKPAERLSFEVTADALGEWAFHCHLLYHMEAGMFRKIVVASR